MTQVLRPVAATVDYFQPPGAVGAPPNSNIHLGSMCHSALIQVPFSLYASVSVAASLSVSVSMSAMPLPLPHLWDVGARTNSHTHAQSLGDINGKRDKGFFVISNMPAGIHMKLCSKSSGCVCE